MSSTAAASRVDWVDYAKGFCIVFVVMMHSTLGVEAQVGHEGWLHTVVAFAKPFRMPDFFMISGLFLARVIDRDWRDYLDRKVVHFAYFYVLWTMIQFALKAPAYVSAEGWHSLAWDYLESFWEPFGTLWFIYLLPIFFVITKAAHQLRIPPVIVWLAAAGLQIASIETGHMVIDEFAARFVYFYTGYLAAAYIFDFADNIARAPFRGLSALLAWGLLNAALVFFGYADLPFISLGLGFVGAIAVISASVLMAKCDLAFRPLRYCGRNSIVIYLAFFLPMAAMRTLLLKTEVIPDIGLMSIIVTLAGVLGALALFWTARGTAFDFLFVRPAALRLQRTPHLVMQPAE